MLGGGRGLGGTGGLEVVVGPAVVLTLLLGPPGICTDPGAKEQVNQAGRHGWVDIPTKKILNRKASPNIWGSPHQALSCLPATSPTLSFAHLQALLGSSCFAFPKPMARSWHGHADLSNCHDSHWWPRAPSPWAQGWKRRRPLAIRTHRSGGTPRGATQVPNHCVHWLLTSPSCSLLWRKTRLHQQDPPCY